nr:Rv2231c family pyridoxal phosphate-dependent protein CobC [Nocardioides mangrovicus]
MRPGPADPLAHHGDVEARGLLDLAVNVFPGPPPGWLSEAMHAALDASGSYPDPTAAERALAVRHGRAPGEVLATAGAAEAFTLLARRPWRRPVVVHPQFTEPHAALREAGHDVTTVLCGDGFGLPAVPDDADLVVVGNPTNPTGVLHPRAEITALARPGRTVVVDEAFMDAVPHEPETLTGEPGVVVTRSLTKIWGIPGVRAGYLVGPDDLVAELRRTQPLWSVSGVAAAALLACASADPTERAIEQRAWREALEKGLADLGVEVVSSSAPFVLARVGDGVHASLRRAGIAVRRCDTFPGLGPDWVRIAARPPDVTHRLLTALKEIR